MKTKPVLTEDGSYTLFVSELNEHYHSVNGAIGESRHVFIDAGYNFCKQTPIRILEIGFGTGLNAYLTYLESKKFNRSTQYCSIELYPLNKNEIQQLNYAELLNADKQIFENLHNTAWNKMVNIDSDFSLHKINADVTTYKFDDNGKFDLIYFDAFSPEKQAEMWTKSVFSKIHKIMENTGILTTYSTKGIVKQVLRDIGFKLERLPGPPGKWHMLRATKNDLLIHKNFIIL
jgi:tRNA U34 5-methylaminomethyl-2-thiouridine-forming methyltransferase MnmC